MSGVLAPYVAILGRGPGRSRSLTLEEAHAALSIALSGEAEPEAVGALLMLMRMKGETAEEIAGFVRAARSFIPLIDVKPDLDWPSYAAGRTRGHPWFLLSAKLVAQAGFSVLLHGWNSHQNPIASVRAALPDLGIASAGSLDEVAQIMTRDGIAYLPLEVASSPLFRLLRLREVLGLRSCINTVLRVLNPAKAAASVQGVFHPPYRLLQADAGAILGQQTLTVLKGGGGEFERHPGKDVALFGLRQGTPWEGSAKGFWDETRRLAEATTAEGAPVALWNGALQDPFAEAIVLATAATALESLGEADGMALATKLWQTRSPIET